MRCAICKNGETAAGFTNITLERKGATILIRNVPAQVCDNCGEAYTDSTVSDRLLAIAEEAAQGGIEVEIRHYKAA